MNLSPLGASAATDAVCRQVNGGSLRIYNGARVLLATLGFAPVAFKDAIDGLAQSNQMTSETNAPASGMAVAFDACDPAGQVIWSGTIGTADADMIMDSVHVAAGATVQVDAITFSFPAGE